MQKENANIKFSTNVLLKDKNTGEVFVDKSNAVHPQNMAYIIARGLANQSDSHIQRVGLGNGGTYVDSAATLHYNAPHTTGTDAQLYNQTYFEVIDGTVVNGNTISPIQSSTDITSTITIDLTIDATEPSGQWLTDAEGNLIVSNPETGGYQFEFDELGCFAKNPAYDALNPNPSIPEFLLLTHIVFHPIAKSQNRQLQLTYTITCSVS